MGQGTSAADAVYGRDGMGRVVYSKGVEGVSLGELKSMMGDSFHRKVRSEWLGVASKQPKLLREVMRKHEEPTVVYMMTKDREK